jgi:prolyl-tRNA synthetase
MEALMHDGQALQSGTSHNLGQHFTKAFEITYLDRENKQSFPYHTSWGVSTRLIGGIIMTHGDDNGLVLPPKIAPIQLVIIPIAQHKEGVLDKAYELKALLEKDSRVKIDDNDGYSPGWKFNQWEMKGVPIRLEIGPRDIENNQCVLARRDTGEKVQVSLDNITETVNALLDEIQENLYQKALKMREEKTTTAVNMTEFRNNLQANPGFVKAMWCGDRECEDRIKEETRASLRCVPFDQEVIGEGKCVCCGKPTEKMAYFARAY